MTDKKQSSIPLDTTKLLGFKQVERVSGHGEQLVESLSRILSKRGGEVPGRTAKK